MKKIFSILLTAVACIAGITACTYDYPVAPMASTIAVTPNAGNAAAAGQTIDVNVTADGSWVVSAPSWITVTPANGTRDQAVKITVAANEGGERTGKVGFYSAVGEVGSTTIALDSTPLAEFTLTQAASDGQGGGQGDDTPTISVADYIALGANTDPYIIKGIITRVANTSYGNFDLTDETGTIYVYGLLNEKLEAQKCWKEKGLAQGDELTVKASELKLYNGTWEIVNAVYVSHTKSLIAIGESSKEIPIEGASFNIEAVVKGADVKVNYAADWIDFTGADKDGELVTLHFTVPANPGIPRSDVITISTTNDKGDSSSVDYTVKQAGETPTVPVETIIAEGASTTEYKVTGVITEVANTSYGNFYLKDNTGTVYVYGLLNEAREKQKCWTEKGLAVGDIITILTDSRVLYNNALQISNAVYVSHVTPVKLETTSVTIPMDGSDFTVGATVNAELGEVEVPEWITYNGVTMDGNHATFSFTAPANEGNLRTGQIKINATAQGLPIAAVVAAEQAGAIPTVTVAEFNEKPDDNTAFFRVQGFVSKVTDLSKGRIYIKDATGETYAYNLKAGKDASSTNLTTVGVELGDVVTVVGYKTTYNTTIELMGYLESFYKVEQVTVEEFLQKEVSTDKWYRLTGTVSKPTDEELAGGNKWDITTYGNFRLEDATGRVYVYGVTTGFNGQSKKFSTLGVKENDEITIVGNRAAYSGAPQVGKAWYVSHTEGQDPAIPPVVSNNRYVKVTEALNDWSGTYLLVCDKDDINMAFSGFSNTIGSGTAVTIENGSIAGNADVDACQIVIAPATVTAGAYTIKFGAKFFAWNSGNALNNVDEESAKANWTISFDTDHVVILNAETTVRNLQWNKTSPRFACYGNNNQTVVQLYRLTVDEASGN